MPPPPIPEGSGVRNQRASTDAPPNAKPAITLTEGITLLKQAAAADKASKAEGIGPAERLSSQQEACELYANGVAVLDEALKADQKMKATTRATIEAKCTEAARRIDAIRRKIASAADPCGSQPGPSGTTVREADKLKVAMATLKAGKEADTAAKRGDASKLVDAVRLYRQFIMETEGVICGGNYDDSLTQTLTSKVMDVDKRLAVLEPQIPEEILDKLWSIPESDPGQLKPRPNSEPEHEPEPEIEPEPEPESEPDYEQDCQLAAARDRPDKAKATADVAVAAIAEGHTQRKAELQQLEWEGVAALTATKQRQKKEDNAREAAAAARASAEQQSAIQVENAVSEAEAAAKEATQVAAAAQ